MDVSNPVPASQPSTVSPDGKHIATLEGLELEVRRISTLEVVRSIHLPSHKQSKFLCIRWSPMVGVGSSNRFLLADEDKVRVWDVQDHDWSAAIDNGSSGMGKIANVEFGSDDSEVMIFSAFGSQVTVWSLWTGKSVEIKDPKFSRRGYGRSRTGRKGCFALLTRPAAQDVVSLHVPGTYEVIKSFTPPTIDAQGLRWSPDGRWLAICDTPSNGYRVLIYTADGNLFRNYIGDYYDDDLKGLGVKNLEWSPNGDFLIIAGFEKKLTLLGTRTFAPALHLSHNSTIKPTTIQIWQEVFHAGERSYTRVMQPITPPSAQSSTDDTAPKVGPSMLGFSADGSYLATRDDSMPTSVWIWDLGQMRCCAVLLQHSVVKKLSWHPTDPNTLLIQGIQGDSSLYIWNALEAGPRIVRMPSVNLSGKAEAQWVPKSANRKPIIVFGDHRGFALAYPDGKEETPSPCLEGRDDSDAQHARSESEDDSVYDALTGRNGAAMAQETPYPPTETIADVAQGHPDDTFAYRRGINV